MAPDPSPSIVPWHRMLPQPSGGRDANRAELLLSWQVPGAMARPLLSGL